MKAVVGSAGIFICVVNKYLCPVIGQLAAVGHSHS